MRIRSILPKFYESEDVGRMDWHTRLIFIGLWSYVDDNGVGRDVDALIASDLFPFDLSRDSRETLARVADALQTLADGHQIIRYTVDGKPLLFVTGWDAYQKVDRPAKERYPRPTRDDAVIRETVATPSRDSRDTLATGEGEKGRRGEDTSSSELRPDVADLLDHLDRCIVANGAKKPNRTKGNADAARLLIDRDGRPLDEAHRLIDWATSDPFWRSNILSMVKFREKYDQLRIKAQGARQATFRVVGGTEWE